MSCTAITLKAHGSAPSLLLLLCLALATPVPAFAGDNSEAERQADYAREELRRGEYDRALHSAESALRLDPTGYEALGLKALAYEGLGQLRLAESLLLAWQEVGGLAELPTPYGDALVRMRADLDGQRKQRAKRQQGRVIQLEPEQPASGVPVRDSTPEVYRERSQGALQGGQCHAAMAAAFELVGVDPDEAIGHRLVGDAERCLGRTRRAALAYRRYQARGGDDAAVADLLADLSASLASVEVQVTLEDPDVVPLLQLEVGGQRIDPVHRDRTSARFEDVPFGAPLVLLVAGRGLKAETRQLDALAPTEARAVAVAPVTVGLGEVVFAAFDAETALVTVRTPDEEVVVRPEQRKPVTAGDITINVATELGAVDVPLTVAPGQEVAFDPSRNLPAGLTVTGVPAGAELRVVVEGRTGVVIERVERIPPELGTIDPLSGLRLAPELTFDSLLGGPGGLFLSHPRLGEAAMEMVLENGAWSGARFDAGTLEGTASVTQRWQAWHRAGKAAAARQRTGSVVSAILGGVFLGGGAAALGLAQVAANKRVRPALVCGGLGPTAASCGEAEELKRQQGALTGGGAVMLGLGAASVTLSITFGVKGANERGEPTGWDPWATEETDDAEGEAQ